MNVQVLRDLLSRRPFEPFRLRLSSGDIYDVRHPEMALLLQTGMYVALPDANGDLPQRAAWCSVLHIAAVETLPVAK
ncbi:MAG: hypothetical protein HYS13_13875 [Planctomycetia bacterium]|nr:hypothetical protein [Planctomycetia bacterium]